MKETNRRTPQKAAENRTFFGSKMVASVVAPTEDDPKGAEDDPKGAEDDPKGAGDDPKYRGVRDARGARIPGVYRRGGAFFARIVDPKSGSRVWRKSPDGSLEGARRLVKLSKRSHTAARALAFSQALDGLRTHRVGWSLRDVLDAYPTAADQRRAAVGRPAERTVREVVSTARRVFAGALDSSFAQIPVVLHDWCVSYNRRSEGGRPTVYAATVSRMVRSLFSPWAMAAYAEKGCRDAAPKWREVVSPDFQYSLPPRELRDRTIAEGKREMQAASPVGRAFLVQFFCAMSGRDAIRARWDWLGEDGVVRYVRHKTGKDCSPRLSQEVAAVWRRLAASPEAGPFVVPGRTERARFDVLQLQLSRWMRDLGWKTPKAGHELRKLMCSIWFTSPGVGATWTQEWSGDSLQVLQKHYARLLPESAPAAPVV